MPGLSLRFHLLLATLVSACCDSEALAEKPLRDAIDAAVRSAWAQQKLTPAAPASDAEFLRRIYLDLVGTIPTYEETLAFLDSDAAGKREKLIDQLLADPRFAQHQADVWDMVLVGRDPPSNYANIRDGFQDWLRSRFEKNVPYDVWVRDLLIAEGTTREGGGMFYVQYKGPTFVEDTTEAVTRVFMGVQIQCARCHDHPFEKWKQLDFYGVAAFLARLEIVDIDVKGSGLESVYAVGEQELGDVLFTGPAINATPGKKGEPVKPKFLHETVSLVEPAAEGKVVRFPSKKVPPKPGFSRREKLIEWLTDPENPYFTKAVANRVWAQFIGSGIVHPVDNLSSKNPPVLPDLFATLSQELVAHNYDLKWYIRELVSSQTYQVSAAGSGEPLPTLYQHARSRPLSAEELASAWRTAIGYTPEKSAKPSKDERYRPFDQSGLIRYFGRPVTGAGVFEGGMQEHLFMNNGPLYRTIGGKNGLAESVGDQNAPVDKRVERLFLQALNRRPSEAEAEKFATHLTSGGLAADAVWSLVTSSEFRFNH